MLPLLHKICKQVPMGSDSAPLSSRSMPRVLVTSHLEHHGSFHKRQPKTHSESHRDFSEPTAAIFLETVPCKPSLEHPSYSLVGNSTLEFTHAAGTIPDLGGEGRNYIHPDHCPNSQNPAPCLAQTGSPPIPAPTAQALETSKTNLHNAV